MTRLPDINRWYAEACELSWADLIALWEAQ